jgi:glycosyltransferase involved in cell wall biosynthesis
MFDIAERANVRITDPREAIEKHFAVFQGIAGLAKRLLLERDYETSAACVQVAGHYAWFHPTGLLASPELEAILNQIGAASAPAACAPARTAQMPPRSVLHVVSEAYSLGGHTRFVWRWIQADAHRTHSVALTRQDDGEVPQPLEAAVEATGGKIYYLDRQVGGLLARAQSLRRLGSSTDHVILHAHPHDVVPLIAFAVKEGRPPLTILNHTDHVFWLGVSVADQVAQIRNSGQKLSEERRGLPESQCVLLPIPVEIKQESRRRAEAKRDLGISEDTVILLSVASPYKYRTFRGEHFADVLLPVLQKHGNSRLLVVGPEERDEWAAANEQAGGRIMAFGRRRDTELFNRAADIYLDSFPFSSLTSFLEAGSYGTPILAYRVHPPDAATLCGDDPALEDLLVQTSSPDDFRSQISRFVEDAELRAKVGELTKKSIIAYHVRGGWNRFLEELYLHVNQHSRQQLPGDDRTLMNVTELDLRLAEAYETSGLARGFRGVVRNHVGLFPLKARMGIWWEIFAHEWRYLPQFLLADWQKTKLRLLWS